MSSPIWRRHEKETGADFSFRLDWSCQPLNQWNDHVTILGPMKFTLSVYNYQWFLENMELSRQLQTSVNYLTFNILLLVLFIVSILVRNGAYSSTTPYMPKLIGCPIYSMFLKSKVCYLDYPKYWGLKCCNCRVKK